MPIYRITSYGMTVFGCISQQRSRLTSAENDSKSLGHLKRVMPQAVHRFILHSYDKVSINPSARRRYGIYQQLLNITLFNQSSIACTSGPRLIATFRVCPQMPSGIARQKEVQCSDSRDCQDVVRVLSRILTIGQCFIQTEYSTLTLLSKIRNEFTIADYVSVRQTHPCCSAGIA